jgi:hypothetical protein
MPRASGERASCSSSSTTAGDRSEYPLVPISSQPVPQIAIRDKSRQLALLPAPSSDDLGAGHGAESQHEIRGKKYMGFAIATRVVSAGERAPSCGSRNRCGHIVPHNSDHQHIGSGDESNASEQGPEDVRSSTGRGSRRGSHRPGSPPTEEGSEDDDDRSDFSNCSVSDEESRGPSEDGRRSREGARSNSEGDSDSASESAPTAKTAKYGWTEERRGFMKGPKAGVPQPEKGTAGGALCPLVPPGTPRVYPSGIIG